MGHPIPAQDRLDFIADLEAWRKTLPDPPVPDFLGGVLGPRLDDPRDWLMPGDPRIADQLSVGFSDTADLLKHDLHTYNQGAVPACVTHTGAQGQTYLQHDEEGQLRVFDAMRAHQETGPMEQGRWPEDIVKYAVARGFPLLGSETRYRLAAYASAPKGPGTEWEDAIMAAIASGRPVWICYLIPQQYGWDSGGGMTSGYHETLLNGYNRPERWFLTKNSWGQSWGRNGLGRLPIDYLKQSNWQNGYVWAHTVVDERANPLPLPDPQPNPQPQPLPTVTVSGLATGGGLEFLQAGMTLDAQGGGFSGKLGPLTVTRTQPQPNPQPNPNPIGDLKIEATPNGTGWWSFRAVAGDRYVNAKIELLGQTKLTQVFGNNRAIAATFWLGNVKGQTVEVIARELNSSRTGMRIITA